MGITINKKSYQRAQYCAINSHVVLVLHNPSWCCNVPTKLHDIIHWFVTTCFFITLILNYKNKTFTKLIIFEMV